MTTANTIIEGALSKLGLFGPGDAVDAESASDCLVILNQMVDSWNLPSWTLYGTTEVTATVAASTASVTIGPSMTLNVTRPVRIEAGCFSRIGGVDYPLDFVSEAEFNSISLKTITGFAPEWGFYDPGAATGTIKLYPQPGASCELHIIVLSQLSQFADLVTDYTLPQGYEKALVYNLALDIAPNFEREAPPSVVAQAGNTLRMLKRSNQVIPELKTYRREPGNIYAGWE